MSASGGGGGVAQSSRMQNKTSSCVADHLQKKPQRIFVLVMNLLGNSKRYSKTIGLFKDDTFFQSLLKIS